MKNPIIELRKYREIKNISQKKLALKMNITQGYISKIENGIESPTLKMIYRFANALEICPRLLLPCCVINCKEHTNCNYGGSINENSK